MPNLPRCNMRKPQGPAPPVVEALPVEVEEEPQDETQDAPADE